MKFYEFHENEKRVDIYNERFYPITIKGKVEWLRNVTTLLGIINKGYNFDEWLKNVGHNAEIITDRAGKFGTAVHTLIQRYLLKEEVSYYDNTSFGDRVATELWERFNRWLDFWKELNSKYKVEYDPKNIEYITYSEKYRYAGTIDLICTVDGVKTIMDWKTGNYLGSKEKHQMVAYMNTINCNKAYLVHIPSKKPNKKGYRPIEVNYTDELFQLFLSIKKVFDSENKDLPKILTLPLSVSLADLKTKE